MAEKKHVQTQTEWENEMSGKILSQIKSELYLDLPFMSIALGKLLPEAKEGLKTFATDGRYVWFSADQLLRIFPSNPKFLDRAYLHSVLHCIFSHLWTVGQRKRRLWSAACDIVVEYTIDGMNKSCTRRILSYLRQHTYENIKKLPYGISAATVYEWLLDQDEPGQEALIREFHTDDHSFWPKEEQGQAPSPQQRQDQAEWQKTARQTRMQQQKRGSDTAEGEQIMAAMLSAAKSRRNYRDFLRQFAVLREELHVDPDSFDLSYYTYGLRLYGNMPLIEPLESREARKIREFVIVLDTSYSTNGDLVKNFLKETFTLLSQSDSFFHRCRIRILQCDDRVRMDQEVSSMNEMEALLKKFTLVGGGGTDFRPAFMYVNNLMEQGELKNLSGLLYFTDGKGTYPGKRPPYQTAFLFLGDYDEEAVPPWAIRLKLDPSEFRQAGANDSTGAGRLTDRAPKNDSTGAGKMAKKTGVNDGSGLSGTTNQAGPGDGSGFSDRPAAFTENTYDFDEDEEQDDIQL